MGYVLRHPRDEKVTVEVESESRRDSFLARDFVLVGGGEPEEKAPVKPRTRTTKPAEKPEQPEGDAPKE